MKKIILILTMVFGINIANAQVDVIKKQIGETLKGTIINTDDNVIVFTYEGQNVEFTIAKNAVEKITYGKTGKVVQVSNKISVNGEADWQKVQIVNDLNLTAGLEIGAQIGTKTDLNDYQSNNGDLAVIKKLKTKAAVLGYPFILITIDKDSNRVAYVYKY